MKNLANERPGLLVSVRDAAEAEAAIAGGAAIIDVKEPLYGALGQADNATIVAVARIVAGRRPVSAALGELFDWPLNIDKSSKWEPQALSDVDYVKIGLSERDDMPNWQDGLVSFRNQVERQSHPRVIAAGYADWERCGACSAYDVLGVALSGRFAGFLIDTCGKDGSTLLDWLNFEQLEEMCRHCREAGVTIALAGSLGPHEMRTLLPAGPDFFAVRGAACDGGREGTVNRERVAALVELLSSPC